jgi:hypothetical protein
MTDFYSNTIKIGHMIQKLYYNSSLSCTKPKSTGNKISHMTSKIKEIKAVYKGLQTLYNTHLPKVDPDLIDDLLIRQQQQKKNPKTAPFYMVEAFTKPGTDSDAVRNIIIEKTSMVPAIYDKGTHYVTNHRLTLEMLKEICDVDYVIEVTGEYTGGITGRGASHEHLDMNDYF